MPNDAFRCRSGKTAPARPGTKTYNVESAAYHASHCKTTLGPFLPSSGLVACCVRTMCANSATTPQPPTKQAFPTLSIGLYIRWSYARPRRLSPCALLGASVLQWPRHFHFGAGNPSVHDASEKRDGLMERQGADRSNSAAGQPQAQYAVGRAALERRVGCLLHRSPNAGKNTAISS